MTSGRKRQTQRHRLGLQFERGFLNTVTADGERIRERRSNQEQSRQREAKRLRSIYRERETSEIQALYSPFLACNLHADHERETAMVALLRSSGIWSLSGLKILDVGCSTGSMLRRLLNFKADASTLFGVDLMEERVNLAHNLNPRLQLMCSDASALPFPNESFDLVIQSTLFTSVLDFNVQKLMAAEILRVMRCHARLIWYDFRYSNPRNKNVRGIGKSKIGALFPRCMVKYQRTTLAPPIARIVCRHSEFLYHILFAMKFLCTHYVCLIQKPADNLAPSALKADANYLEPLANE